MRAASVETEVPSVVEPVATVQVASRPLIMASVVWARWSRRMVFTTPGSAPVIISLRSPDAARVTASHRGWLCQRNRSASVVLGSV